MRVGARPIIEAPNKEKNAMDAVRLTVRESEVLQLIAHGCTYSQVADRLGVSAHTVASHIKNAYRKLDVHSAAAAVMRAIELRLLGEAAAASQDHGMVALPPRF